VQDIEVQGDFAYIANAESGFQIVRVRPAATAAPLAGVTGGGLAVAASGPLAYFQNLGVLEVYDLAAPSSPVLLGSVDVPGGSIDVEGGLAVLTSTAREVALVDVLDPHAPALRSMWGTPGNAVDADLDGTLAYVACGQTLAGSGLWSGFVVVDASEPGTPHEIGRYKTLGGTQAIRVRDGVAYIASHDSLQVVDVSDPAAPRFVGGTRVGSLLNALDVDGEFAYVAIRRAGVAIVEVSTPSSPRVVARVPMPTDPEGISVRNGVACIATQDGVAILDVLDPRTPRRSGLATWATAGWHPTAVRLADGALLVTNRSEGPALSIFPLPCVRTTPLAFGELEYSREPGAIHLRARLGEPIDRLRLRRAVSPDATTAVLVHEEPGLAAGTWSYDDRTVHDEASYTYVLEITIGENTVRSAALLVPASGARRFGLGLASANPGSGPARIRYEIDRPSPAQLDVYDVAGRLVRNLHRGPAPGSHVAEWDGRDGSGSPATTGVYLVRLECGGEVATLRLVRTR